MRIREVKNSETIAVNGLKGTVFIKDKVYGMIIRVDGWKGWRTRLFWVTD